MTLARFTVRRLLVAVALAAVCFAALRSEGSPLLGGSLVLAATLCLTCTRFVRIRRTEPGRWRIARATLEAVFVVGICDAAFLGAFLGSLAAMDPRRSHQNPYLNTPLFGACVAFGTVVALCVAGVIRRFVLAQEPTPSATQAPPTNPPEPG